MTAPTTDTPAPITLRADSRRLQMTLVAALLLVATAAFGMGVPGLLHVGAAAGLGALVWAGPIVLDGGQVVAALAWAMRRSHQRSARFEASLLAALCAISVYAQLVHVADTGGGHPATTLASALLAAAAPLTTLCASHAAIRAA